MNAQEKVNAKRCIQVLMPSIPGPLVDYALTNYANTISQGQPQGVTPGSSPPGSGGFILRKMDSGDFGELSLTPHKGGRHLKNNSFGEPASLSFSYADLDYSEKPRGKAHAHSPFAHPHHNMVTARAAERAH